MWTKLVLWVHQFLINLCSKLVFIPFIKTCSIGQTQGHYIIDFPQVDKIRILVHCASSGELESVIPIIDKLRDKNSEIEIYISFFSSSGFHNTYLTNEWIRWFGFLPKDTDIDVAKFLEKIRPHLIIVSQNDIWPIFLKKAMTKNIPVTFVGMKKKNSFLNRVMYRMFFPVLKLVNHYYVLDFETSDLLDKVALNNNSVIGDPRNIQILKQAESRLPHMDNMAKEAIKPIAIFGSIHREDWDVIRPALDQLSNQYFLIFIPHDIDESWISLIPAEMNIPQIHRIEEMSFHFKGCVLRQYGVLKHLYKYAEVVYLGGGFTKGVHNIMEALIHRKRVFIGPKNDHVIGIDGLKSKKIIIEIKDHKDLLINILNLSLISPDEWSFLKSKYFEKGEKIVDNIVDHLLALHYY